MQNESTPDTKPRQRRSQRFFHKSPPGFVGRLTETEWRLVRETTDWARLGQLAQFWSKVDRSAGDDGCWLWTASKSLGRGMLRIGGVPMVAARVAYEMAYGPIPAGLWVLHDCPDGDNPACVNPEHLFLGTPQDNVDDMIEKRRHRYGENSSRAKLTETQVRAIYQRHTEDGTTQRQLAREYEVTHQHIYEIIHGLSWRHLNLCGRSGGSSEKDQSLARMMVTRRA